MSRYSSLVSYHLRWEDYSSRYVSGVRPFRIHMLLGHDYVYPMNVMMSTLIRVMHIHQN
jgi:hypothetical protein